MNTSLRKRLIGKYGEPYVRQLELAFRPLKIERTNQKGLIRVSKRVVRRAR